ncbi:hypothetical protein EIK77_004495 [Talaromyces pinophilus]|nr:hypothetical protein EIK77_004495 [Talaromyces pinophilus]
MGNTTVKSGQRFTGVVPPPLVPSEEIMNRAGFMHPLERFGPSDLKAVLAFRVNSGMTPHVTTNGVNFSIPIVYLEETSAVDLTSLVDEDGRLNWMVPSGNSSWRIFSFWQEYTNQRSVAGAFNATSFIGNGSWTVDHFSKKGAQRVTEFFDDYIIVDEETAELLKSLSDIPLVDAPECESLGFADNVDLYRQFSGPAHLAGKTVISNEMGAVKVPAFSLTIPDLLFRIKRAMSGGVTMNVLHGSPYSGDYPNTTWPGYTAFFYVYTEMWNRIQPAWNHMKDILDYVGRNQFVLQKGVIKVDLAFYQFQSPWNSLPANFSELVTKDNLLLPQAAVIGGILAPAGPAYKSLIFSSQGVITVKAAERVANFAKSGLPVIVVGNPPNTTYPATSQEQHRLQAIMESLMSSTNVHKVSSLKELPSLLSDLKIQPRVSLDCSQGPVYSVWRHDEKEDIEYVFLYNDVSSYTSCEAEFSTMPGKSPYLFDAWTGTRTALSHYKKTTFGLSIALKFQANETIIIGFENPMKDNPRLVKCHVTDISGDVASLTSTDNGEIVASVLSSATITLSTGKTWKLVSNVQGVTNLSSWHVSIENWQAPANIYDVNTVTTVHNFSNQKLLPWTELSEQMKIVGGVGYYTTTFISPNSSKISSKSSLKAILSIGPIIHTARAFINKVQLPPIDPVRGTVDISGYVQPGKNYTLTIEVTSPLFNRIKATANTTMVWGVPAALTEPAYATLPYKDYGLLGPVSIQWAEGQSIKC